MRVIRILVALAAIALGLVLGALNAQPILVDLGLLQWPTTLGVALLVALLSGVVLAGLLLSISVIAPLRERLRRAAVPIAAHASTMAITTPARESGMSIPTATVSSDHSLEP